MSKDKPERASEQPSRAETEAGSGNGDTSLFRRAMSDARPLDKDVLEPTRRRIPAKARFAKRDEQDVLDESLNARPEDTEDSSGESLGFLRPSVGRRTFRKLARGRFSVQAEIDLHGMTTVEARDALRAFIESSVARGLTCVRVIHGKGLGSGITGPVLKRKVDAWLRRWNPILAFTSAKPVDGGTGAVYVLLKQK